MILVLLHTDLDSHLIKEEVTNFACKSLILNDCLCNLKIINVVAIPSEKSYMKMTMVSSTRRLD